MKLLHKIIIYCASLISCAISLSAHAQIDKVYHPYVQPGERELEFRTNYQHDNDQRFDNIVKSRFALGYSITNQVMLETYLIAEKDSFGSYSLEAYELEAKWQMTEQGEYAADWGLLLELEKQRNKDSWESSAALLVEKELGPWSITTNLFTTYEYGSDVKNEWEASFASQLRYRLRKSFEPGFELYAAENTLGVGPIFMGTERLGLKKIKWETGLIFALDGDSAAHTLRFLLEYEF